MIPYRRSRGATAKDGWNSFNFEPPSRVRLHVYVEDDDQGFWISDCEWDYDKKELVTFDGYLEYGEGNPRALFWRRRPDPPSLARIKTARAKPPIPHREKYVDRVKPSVAQGPGEVLSYGDWETVET